MSKIVSIMQRVERVAEAKGYSTGFDAITQKFRVIGPDGSVYESKFSTRGRAECRAVTTAKIAFAKKDKNFMLSKAQSVLGNSLIEEIGEDNLFEGPLYGNEDEYRDDEETDL